MEKRICLEANIIHLHSLQLKCCEQKWMAYMIPCVCICDNIACLSSVTFTRKLPKLLQQINRLVMSIYLPTYFCYVSSRHGKQLLGNTISISRLAPFKQMHGLYSFAPFLGVYLWFFGLPRINHCKQQMSAEMGL